MKKYIIMFFAVFLLLFSSKGEAFGADSYQVRKGDYVTKIAKEQFHLSWSALSEEARNRNNIKIGEVISIHEVIDLNREMLWKKAGGNPFRIYPEESDKQFARDREGLSILGLSDQEADRVMTLVTKVIRNKGYFADGFRWGEISHGDRFDRMLFGRNFIWQHFNVVVGFEDRVVARVYDLESDRPGYRKELWVPVICSNFAIRYVEIPEDLPPETPEDLGGEEGGGEPPSEDLGGEEGGGEPPPPETKNPFVMPEEEYSLERFIQDFDLLVGATDWRGTNPSYSETSYHGNTFFASMKWMPVVVNLEEGWKFKFGPNFLFSTSHSKDFFYNYTADEEIFRMGLSLKWERKGLSLDFSPGISQHKSEGSGAGGYQNEQKDTSLALDLTVNWHDRRLQEKKWFPETEFVLASNFPFDSTQSHNVNGVPLPSQVYDRQTVGVTINQFIYDYKISKTLLFSSGIGAEGGYEWGPGGHYLGLGPVFKINWYGHDIFQLRPLNFRKSYADPGYHALWLETWLKPVNLWKAWTSYRIDKASSKDRELLEEE